MARRADLLAVLRSEPHTTFSAAVLATRGRCSATVSILTRGEKCATSRRTTALTSTTSASDTTPTITVRLPASVTLQPTATSPAGTFKDRDRNVRLRSGAPRHRPGSLRAGPATSWGTMGLL